MIWKSKYTKETYPHGTTRVKRVFAWLPFQINGDTVWLETYEIYQLYTFKEFTVLDVESGKQLVFKVNEWINLSYRTITK